MRRLLAADHNRTAWKNGAGETAQIAAFPANAGLDDFIWRISMATIASNADFSVFPGVDRTIVGLDGAGVKLSLPAGEHILAPGGAPFRFSGDVPSAATLLSGPVQDFNVMSRRVNASHRVEPVFTDETVIAEDDVSAIFALDELTLRLAAETVHLGKWDLLFLEVGTRAVLGAGTALAVHLKYA